MYSKKDYMNYFLKMKDIESLNYQQIMDLFLTCIRHDSFKLGLQLYCRFLKGPDITPEVMHRLTQSIKDSPKYLEIKLFFIHEHFSLLDVEAMNLLIDTVMGVLKRRNYAYNPILSCYNPVKVALLVYLISYRI